MKKIFAIIILSILIFINVFSYTYAVANITEDELKSSIDEIIDNYASSVEVERTINKDDKTITFKAKHTPEDGGTREYIVKYDLTDKPQFEIDMSYIDSMTKQEWEQESKKSMILYIMFAAVADTKGVKTEDALLYIYLKTLSVAIREEIFSVNKEYDNALEFEKDMLNKNKNVYDDIFTMELEKVEETANEIKTKCTLIVNTDKNFSVMNSNVKDEEQGGTVTDPDTTGGTVTDPDTTGGTVTDPDTTGGTVTDPGTTGGTVTDPGTTGGTVTDSNTIGNTVTGSNKIGNTVTGSNTIGDITLNPDTSDEIKGIVDKIMAELGFTDKEQEYLEDDEYSQDEDEKSITQEDKKLPQTGKEIGAKEYLEIIIVMAVVSLIGIRIYVKRYKK